MKLAQYIALAATLLLAGCDVPCRTNDAVAFPSPDGKFVAWIFKFYCGSETPFSRQVSILPASIPLPAHRNGNAYSQFQNALVKVHWLGADELEIVVDPKAHGTPHRPPVPVKVRYACTHAPTVWVRLQPGATPGIFSTP